MFEFATAGRIVFGAGALREAGAIAAAWGKRAFVVVSGSEAKAAERAAPLIAILNAAGVEAIIFSINGEPTVDAAVHAEMEARRYQAEMIIGFGGGSAIDLGKAVAAFLTNPGDILQYLEVIGAGKPIEYAPLPYMAIPTTAGTGAEVTRNAVLAEPRQQVKVSVRSPLMLPRVALIDPELTYHLSREATASTGMDAITQLIEPFVSPAANPLTDTIARQGLRRARALHEAYSTSNPEARESMSFAALCGGLALANAKLGAVHGFAAPLGGMFPIPHGAACARLLPFVMRENLSALRQRAPLSPALARYDEIARILTGDPNASADDGASWVADLCEQLAIPPLAHWGITPDRFGEIVDKSMQASSMKGNPIALTPDELTSILALAT